MSDKIYRAFKTKNYGVNYEGFQHPLSPYYIKDNSLFAAHPQPGGIGYKHWIGLVENAPDGSKRAARVVEKYRSRPNAPETEIWAFGYDMKSNKARCWYDAKMPIFSIPEEIEIGFRDGVTRLIEAADKSAEHLRNHLKEALFGKGNVRGDLRFIQAEFWGNTEAAFYEHLRQLREALTSDPNAYPVRESWWRTIRDSAFMIFDQHSRTGDFDAVDPKRIAEARNGLGRMLNGPALKEKILGLPKPLKPRRQKS